MVPAAALVFLAALGAALLTQQAGRVASISLANAIVLLALMDRPPRDWPLWLVSGGIGNLSAALVAGDGSLISLVLTFCDLVEVLLAAWLVHRVRRGSPMDLHCLKPFYFFVAIAGVLAPLVSGLMAGGMLHLGKGMPFWAVVRTWYSANALGNLILVPLAQGITLREVLRTLREHKTIPPLWLLVGIVTCAMVGLGRLDWIFLLTPLFLAGTFSAEFLGATGGLFVAAVCGSAALAFWGGQGAAQGRLLPDMEYLQSFIFINVLVCLPIASLLAARRQAIDEKRIVTVAIEQSPVTVVITDPEGRITYVNPRFTEHTGYAADEAVGRSAALLKSGRTASSVYQELWSTIKSGRIWRGELLNRRKDRSLFWELATIAPVTEPGGRITHFVAIKEDITLIKAAKEQLEHLAHHDALTGLPNRVLFQERLRQALAQARRRKSRLAVLFMDLDGFKGVNDTFGHESGDALLVAASQRLKGCLRESDTLARMGGDEFTALLEDLNQDAGAERVAQACIQALAPPFPLPGGEARVGVSIGMAIYPRDGGDLDTLLSAADSAMYEAKRSGKGTFRNAGAPVPAALPREARRA